MSGIRIARIPMAEQIRLLLEHRPDKDMGKDMTDERLADRAGTLE